MPVVEIDTDRTYTISRYAKVQRITRQTVYKWIKEGVIESHKVNGTTLVIGDALPDLGDHYHKKPFLNR